MMLNDALENTVTIQNFKEYVDYWRAFDKPNTELGSLLEYDIFGLVGEAGEVASEMKKLQRGTITPKEFTETTLLECGDVLHYIVKILDDLGYSLQDAMEANIEKLENRRVYGKGKFGTRS
jgi:NTP pyrophosphatase (non-canonical NTP hydrolase)